MIKRERRDQGIPGFVDEEGFVRQPHLGRGVRSRVTPHSGSFKEVETRYPDHRRKFEYSSPTCVIAVGDGRHHSDGSFWGVRLSEGELNGQYARMKCAEARHS